jgi:hypothetical protein
MGKWSPGLYGNDVTADLKTVMRDLVRLPLTGDELVQQAMSMFAGPTDTHDEMYTSFCLALADQAHVYGLDAPSLYLKAREIAACGADVEIHRQLGMPEGDLRRRQQEIRKLIERISRPNPKPRNRRLLEEPETYLFEEGDMVIYPTQAGQAINPYFPKRLLDGWARDNWGGFVVWGRDRIYGYLAAYLIAVLPPLGPMTPEISGIGDERDFACVAELVHIPPTHPRRMQLKQIGRFAIKRDQIEAHFVPGTPPFHFRPQVLANALVVPVMTSPQEQRLRLSDFVELCG